MRSFITILLLAITLCANAVTFSFNVKGTYFRMIAIPEDKPEIESDYFIEETEVSQALWQAVMGNNPSRNKYPMLPVDGVSWNDCQIFIHKLNALLASDLGDMHFELPSITQWEYAARGAAYSKGYQYSGSDNIKDVAWFEENSDKPSKLVALWRYIGANVFGRDYSDVGRSQYVASKRPNEIGLYDMTGNVKEWCGSSTNAKHVLCGGGWSSNREGCKIGYREFVNNTYYNSDLGFRLVLVEGRDPYLNKPAHKTVKPTPVIKSAPQKPTIQSAASAPTPTTHSPQKTIAKPSATPKKDRVERVTTGNNYTEYIYHADGGVTITTYIQCTMCGGSTICPMCHGVGGQTMYYGGIVPPQFIPCAMCNMSGVCSLCHGLGGILNSTYTPPSSVAPVVSDYSSGSTYIPISSPSTSSEHHHHSNQSHYGYQDCTHCWGSGKCSGCNGTGLVYSPYHEWRDRCPNCSGSGKCEFCHGSGQRYVKLY